MTSTRKGSNRNQSNVSVGASTAIVDEQIKNLGDKFRCEMELFKKELERVRKSSDTVSEITVDSVQERFRNFEIAITSELGQIREQIKKILSSLNRLEVSVDVSNQRTLKNKLLIYGIEENPDSKTARNLIAEAVGCLNKRLSGKGIDIQENDISNAYLLGKKRSDGKYRPVLLEFTRVWQRDLIYFNKSAFKGSKIIIAEVLTRPRHAIYLEAKKRFGKNCWTVNGAIYVFSEGSRHLYSELTLKQSSASAPADGDIQVDFN